MSFNFDLTVGCPDGRELRFTCPPKTTVGTLKEWCCKAYGKDAKNFLLTYDGRALRLNRPLDQENLVAGKNLQLVWREDSRPDEQNEAEGWAGVLGRPAGTKYDRGVGIFGEDWEDGETGEGKEGEGQAMDSLPALVMNLTNQLQSQSGHLSYMSQQQTQMNLLLGKIARVASSSSHPLATPPLVQQPIAAQQEMSDAEALTFDDSGKKVYLRTRHAEDDELVLKTVATAKATMKGEWEGLTRQQKMPFLCRAKNVEENEKK